MTCNCTELAAENVRLKARVKELETRWHTADGICPLDEALPDAEAMRARLAAKSARNLTTGCLEWTACRNKSGYGTINYKRWPTKAHRLSFAAHKGPIPRGMQVLHRCDNRRCIEPDHLFLGTIKENTHDMAKKDRATSPLTTAKVLEIRAKLRLGAVGADLGKEYGVSKGTISSIKMGRTWGHVAELETPESRSRLLNWTTAPADEAA